MARTKASVGARLASGKSSKARCSAPPPPSSSGSAGKDNNPGASDRSSRSSSGGGNPVCPRETPVWQKPITRFFGAPNNHSSDCDKDAGPSHRSSKPKDITDDSQPKESDSNKHDSDADKSQNDTISDENEDLKNAKRRKSKNIIQSDDEAETAEELDQSKDRDSANEIVNNQSDEELDRPKNKVLDESIILEPLTGENSHKIDEYYLNKNKGKGKKSKENKENIDLKSNGLKKRCLDDDDIERVSKKVKVAIA